MGRASNYFRSGHTAPGTSQQYYSAPRARSGWANYRYQQQRRPTSKNSISIFWSGTYLCSLYIMNSRRALLHGSSATVQMPAGISANLAAFLRGMTRYDGYFHLLMGGALVGGILFMGTAGEAMWNSINKGVPPCILATVCLKFCKA